MFSPRLGDHLPHLDELPEPARASWFSFDHFYSDWAFQQAQDHVLNYAPRCLYDVGATRAVGSPVRPGIPSSASPFWICRSSSPWPGPG